MKKMSSFKKITKNREIKLFGITVILAFLMIISGALPAAALTITYQPGPADGKDSGVWNRSGFADTNFGASELFWTQHNGPSLDYWYGYGYYQFDLSSILSPLDVITSAEVTFHHRYASGTNPALYGWGGGIESYAVESVGSGWDEMGITWNTQPGSDGYFSASTTVNPGALTWQYSSGNWYAVGTATIDITALVQAWNSGTKDNYGIIYRMTDYYYYGGQDGAVYSSDAADEALRPMLEITYEPVPEPATMLLLGSGLVGLAGVRRRLKKQM